MINDLNEQHILRIPLGTIYVFFSNQKLSIQNDDALSGWIINRKNTQILPFFQ